MNRPLRMALPLTLTLTLALAIALQPLSASAALRGAWDFLTNGVLFNAGLPTGCEHPTLRPGLTTPTGGHALVEHWLAFSTRSAISGESEARAFNSAESATRVTPRTCAAPVTVRPSGLIISELRKLAG